MFWKAKVRVSEQSYRFSLPVIYLMRLMGIFPIAIYRDRLGLLYMQWSPLYATYSWSLGIFLQSTAYVGMFKDLLADHSESVRVRSRTDVFVNFGDVTATQIVTFAGIFIIPTRFLTFFAYIQCINEADAILMTKHSKWEKLNKFLTCYGTLLAIFLSLLGDYLMYVKTVGKHLGALSIFRTYATYYITCMILMITEYEFQYMASSLAKRIQRLNKILETFNSMGSQPWRGKRATKAKIPSWNAWKKHTRLIKNGSYVAAVRITDLMRAYLKLTDAAGHQNTLLGATGAIAILAGFWHLITASYFLLSELGGSRRDPVFITMKMVWCMFHTGRLLMIIEPWYICTIETETTKKLVCKLTYSSFGRQLSRELRTFQLILGLKTIDFSLAGLADIDRSLLTSVLGTTSTYLVILLQYNAEDVE